MHIGMCFPFPCKLQCHIVSHLTFTLAPRAMAGPVKRATSGVRIPLPKRDSLTKPDGTFDMEKAILQGIATKKYVLGSCRTA